MLSFIAPISGISLAELLQSNAYDVLISFDDLNKHAKVQRELALLAYKIPQRDAFPSDTFNIHSALLERASKHNFSGSLTAFPFLETINSDISEQVSTNVISISDGQIYTSAQLFKTGMRPSIDSALSVSRVGSTAQFRLMKLLIGNARNDLTNQRQNNSGSNSGSTNSNSNANPLLISKGRALECMFQQDQLDATRIEETTVILFLFNKGFLSNLVHCTIEWFNKRLLPVQRLLIGVEFLQLDQLIFITKHIHSAKAYRLLERQVLVLYSTFQSSIDFATNNRWLQLTQQV